MTMHQQQSIIPETEQNLKNSHSIGRNLTLEFSDKNKGQCQLLNREQIVKVVDLSDKVAKKCLVVDAIDLGARPSHSMNTIQVPVPMKSSSRPFPDLKTEHQK